MEEDSAGTGWSPDLDLDGRFTTSQLEMLTLPTRHSSDLSKANDHLESVLDRPGYTADDLHVPLNEVRKASLADLARVRGHRVLDWPKFLVWPDSLFIPRAADGSLYFPAPTPADHRYSLDWTTGAPNQASRDAGTSFAFAQVPWSNPASASAAQAGVGIFYTPKMSLGVVDFQPHVNVNGMLTSVLDYFPTLSAGKVRLSASLLLACWEVIPTGFDLLSYRSITVESEVRDQSFGAERNQFSASFAGNALTAPFLVQAARTYLLGVVGAVSATSNLTDTYGRPLPGTTSSNFKVYSWMATDIPQMNVIPSRVYIP
ncbi:hypothetical protein BH09ACT6_BH09ACT6_27480 [soil metagenome]